MLSVLGGLPAFSDAAVWVSKRPEVGLDRWASLCVNKSTKVGLPRCGRQHLAIIMSTWIDYPTRYRTHGNEPYQAIPSETPQRGVPTCGTMYRDPVREQVDKGRAAALRPPTFSQYNEHSDCLPGSLPQQRDRPLTNHTF